MIIIVTKTWRFHKTIKNKLLTYENNYQLLEKNPMVQSLSSVPYMLMFLTLPSCQEDEFEQNIMSPSSLSNKVKLTGKVKDVDGNWCKTEKIGEH
jgi:hypothetical protein